MKKLICTLSILFLVAALIGCTPYALTLSDIDGDLSAIADQITVNTGDTFAIKLNANMTTGYTWQVSIADDDIVTLKDSTYQTDNDNKVGSGGIRTFVFYAVSSGTTDITLTYGQDWQGGQTDSTKTITVIVK